jgi:hypothetical protein
MFAPPEDSYNQTPDQIINIRVLSGIFPSHVYFVMVTWKGSTKEHFLVSWNSGAMILVKNANPMCIDR